MDTTLPVAILNASVITADGSFDMTTISLEEARQLVRQAPLDSAVGHESTAELLTTLLGVQVPVNRQLFAQAIGQRALVCKLNGRPPEGKVLSREDLDRIGFSFKLLVRTA